MTTVANAVRALHDDLAAGRITKRTFLRSALALGVPMGTAIMMAQSSGDPSEDITATDGKSAPAGAEG